MSVNNTVTLIANGASSTDATNVAAANVITLNVSANIANAGNVLVTQNVYAGNLSITQNSSTGNLAAANVVVTATVQGLTLTATQNTSTGNLSVTQNVSAGNIAAANVTATATVQGLTLTATQNTSTGNLSVTQNVSAGNVSISALMNVVNMNVSQNIANAGNVLVTQNVAAGNLAITQNTKTGNLVVTTLLNVATLNVSTAIDAANGTVAAPAYSFGAQTNTGMYLAGVITLGFAANGNGILNIAQTSINVSTQAVLNVAQNTVTGNLVIVQNTTTGNISVTQNTSTGNLSITQNTTAGNISAANVNVSGTMNAAIIASPYVATVNNGSVVLQTANMNFLSTSTINVAVAANGTNQANVSLTANLSGITANPGGANTQVQFNNNGALGGSPNVVFNLNGNTFTVSTNVAAGNLAVTQNTSTGNLSVTQNGTVGNLIVSQNLTTGNLTVSGTMTVINTSFMDVDANAIYLNANQAGSPALNAYIYDERGSSPNTFLIWNENNQHWGYSDDGSTINYFATISTIANTANSVANVANVTMQLAYFANSFQTTNTSSVIIDAWSATTYRTAKYLVSVLANNAGTLIYQASEIIFTQDGTFTYQSEYGDVYTGAQLTVFTSAITGGVFLLNVAPTYSNTLVRTVRTLIPV